MIYASIMYLNLKKAFFNIVRLALCICLYCVIIKATLWCLVPLYYFYYIFNDFMNRLFWPLCVYSYTEDVLLQYIPQVMHAALLCFILWCRYSSLWINVFFIYASYLVFREWGGSGGDKSPVHCPIASEVILQYMGKNHTTGIAMKEVTWLSYV